MFFLSVFAICVCDRKKKMATTGTSAESPVERYPDKNASQIQQAISALSSMESKLDDLSSQVTDMKRRLLVFAENESGKAKAEILDAANKEAQSSLDSVRLSAQKEADGIVAKGSVETEKLRQKISGKIDSAVDIIVKAVQSA